jgi:CRP/FNR family transcriptional regulator
MDHHQPFCYLSQFDLFESITDEEIRSKLIQVGGKKFEKNEVIYSPHQESQLIYILREGEVTLYHSHEGKKESFDTIGPGTLFGNFNPDSKFPSHFAEATRDSTACIIPIQNFIDMMKTKPELMMKLIQMMAERLQDYEQRFKNNLQTAKETVFRELSRLQEKKKKGILGKWLGSQIPPLRLTHEQIASLTGLNRVTVTRSLKELKEEGMLSIHPSSGVIELFPKQE